MELPRIPLCHGKEHIMNAMHPWIFSKALAISASRSVPDGVLADVMSPDCKRFLARGYYNGASQIAFRILTRSADDTIGQVFFERRFREFLSMRERFIDTRRTNSFRVVFGESDGMPGLIVDKYNRVFVFQIHTLGMERLREPMIAAMKSAFAPETIFEKSDVGVRRLEGLQDLPVRHVFGKKLPREIEILEHGVKFFVNVTEGQKTGFFLDQRENRKALQAYVKDKRVLNCFCYTGGFSVYAALAGARETASVDVSGEALETANRNFEANGIPSKHHFFADQDVFEVLEEYEKKKERFDVIILDPPAFVKNKKSLRQGLRGYLFINERALKLLPTGGILVSSSCSAHVTDEIFQKTLALAAARTGCTLKTLEIRHQPIDHPYNPHFPEGKYLKFYVMLKV
ncbi:class I SAM-dependent rRNA methyltransferase [Candidatus Peregrinibacteria bacterium]|nr:class I SAM-dependent rRNA methyltransferase [Candidatus Peregrinibacteria bacterium]